METLDGGESDLEADVEPPSFFQRPEHEPNYKKISNLRQEIEEEEIDPYISQFDDTIKDDVLMIGNISLEEVQVPNHEHIPELNFAKTSSGIDFSPSIILKYTLVLRNKLYAICCFLWFQL